jgi:hypothetical protein
MDSWSACRAIFPECASCDGTERNVRELLRREHAERHGTIYDTRSVFDVSSVSMMCTW